MATARKQAQRETREKLLNAARSLTVRRGIGALSTRSVCEAGRVAAGTDGAAAGR